MFFRFQQVISHIVLVLCFVIPFAGYASAEVGWKEGVRAINRIPDPIISDQIVVLDVPHVSQGTRPWCVPASVAISLAYYGIHYEPSVLKQLAEDHKPEAERNVSFTYWADMLTGLRQIGARWTIHSYEQNDRGFQKGFSEIRRQLRKGRPVLIEVHLREGHTFVLIGYNDNEQVVYIRDPLLKRNQVRVLSYATIRDDWNRHRFGDGRDAFFTRP